MAKREYIQAQRLKPIGAEGIEACRRIVAEKQAAKVNQVMVDLFSASAIVRVYDAVNDENKARLEAKPVAIVADIVFRLLNHRSAA